MSRDGNDRPGTRSVPSRFLARSSPDLVSGREGPAPPRDDRGGAGVVSAPVSETPEPPRGRRPAKSSGARLIVTAPRSWFVNIEYWQVEVAERMLAVPASPGRPPGARPRGAARARRARTPRDRSGPGGPAGDRAGRRAAPPWRDPDGYAGLPDKHLAFALALILDELARHVRDLQPKLRVQTMRGVRMLLGG